MTHQYYSPSPGTTVHYGDAQRGVPPILCRNCHEEIESIGSVTYHGFVAGHTWTHAESKTAACPTMSPFAEPWDHYEAERRLTARLAAERMESATDDIEETR